MPTPFGWVSGNGTLLVLASAIMLGCTSIRTRTIEKGDVTMTEEQFAAHVEHVFRYHNRVMNDVGVVGIDLGPARRVTPAPTLPKKKHFREG